MTTVNLDTISRLVEHHASLGDGRDCKSDREKADWYAATTTCQRVIGELKNLPSDLAAVETKLRDVEASRAMHLEKRAEIEQQIADAPDPLTIRDARQRDAESERQRQLRQSLQLLHDGRLLVAPGVQLPSMAYLEQRIAELTERRDRAQRALDGYVQAAEQLLAEQPVEVR